MTNENVHAIQPVAIGGKSFDTFIMDNAVISSTPEGKAMSINCFIVAKDEMRNLGNQIDIMNIDCFKRKIVFEVDKYPSKDDYRELLGLVMSMMLLKQPKQA